MIKRMDHVNNSPPSSLSCQQLTYILFIMSTTHLLPLYYDQQLISILFIMSTTHLYPLYHVNNSPPSSLSCQQLTSILFIMINNITSILFSMSTHHLPHD